MEITEKMLGTYARETQEMLRYNHITSLKKLYLSRGMRVDCPSGHVEFSLRHSQQTQALTISYINEAGIPLEIRYNKLMLYIYTIIKCQTPLSDFTCFAKDNWNNFIQTRQDNLLFLHGHNYPWTVIQQRLESLSYLRLKGVKNNG
jgi:hypothetical protein